MDSDGLTRKITAMHQINNEIIERIKAHHKEDSKVTSRFQYAVTVNPFPNPSSPNLPFSFSVTEKPKIITTTDFIENWRVPKEAQKTEDIDPEKTMYGLHVELMNTKCETFQDLIRLNSQIVVAMKYLTMLKEELAVSYGRKFLTHFELVQTLLGSLESQLIGEMTQLNEIQKEIDAINLKISTLFQNYSIFHTDHFPSDELEWAICNGTQLNQFKIWKVPTMEFVQKNWNSFKTASQKGIKSLSTFTQTNPLLHFLDGQSMSYVYLGADSTSYLSSREQTSHVIQLDSKIWFKIFNGGELSTPPIRSTKREAIEGYLVLVYRQQQ